MKTLPVYCHWTSDENISYLLVKMTEQIQSVRDSDLFSYADLNLICPMNNAPMFVYHVLIKTISEFCDKPCTEEILDRTTAGKNFAVELMDDFEKMQLRIEYNSSQYSEKFIEDFATCYENVLRQLMTKTFIREVELLDNA